MQVFLAPIPVRPSVCPSHFQIFIPSASLRPHADMEVDKVANMVANIFADIVAKKGTQFGKRKKRVPNLVRGACKKEEEERVPN